MAMLVSWSGCTLNGQLAVFIGPWVNPRHGRGPRDQVTALAKRGTEAPGMIIYPAASWGSSLFKFPPMARANDDLYGSTVKLLYSPRVDVVRGVAVDAAAECFCKI